MAENTNLMDELRKKLANKKLESGKVKKSVRFAEEVEYFPKEKNNNEEKTSQDTLEEWSKKSKLKVSSADTTEEKQEKWVHNNRIDDAKKALEQKASLNKKREALIAAAERIKPGVVSHNSYSESAEGRQAAGAMAAIKRRKAEIAAAAPQKGQQSVAKLPISSPSTPPPPPPMPPATPNALSKSKRQGPAR